MISKYHLKKSERPPWLVYPSFFEELIGRQLVDVGMWYLMPADRVLQRIDGLKKRYPDRELVPFAKRDDNDDLACWDSKFGCDKIAVIHDFASSGYEDKESFASFEDWHRNAVSRAKSEC